MSYRKFGKNDVLINTLKTYPKNEFFIYSGSVFHNNRTFQPGSFRTSPNNVYMTPPGFANLYEYNIDRVTGSNDLIYPYMVKDGSRATFFITASTTRDSTMADYDTAEYGDLLIATYPQFASIRREFIKNPSGSCVGESKDDCAHNMSYWSLKNMLNHYKTLSPHYAVHMPASYVHGPWNKDEQELNLIHIPSIFYGSKIRPGTVSLKWYLTGSLIGELRDTKENGELIQVSGSTYNASASPRYNTENIGSVAGVVLYDEGFILLTGSWPLNGKTVKLHNNLNLFPRWKYWGFGARDGEEWNASDANTSLSASFKLNFEGINKTEVMTMYAHAPRGEVNYSNNPTFIEYDQRQINFTSSHVYEENKNRLIKNTVSSSFKGYDEKFKRQVYINKVGVYDKQKNLIGIATLAEPILKEEAEQLTFKIKLDI
tara:strand:- start:1066 stop:2352 length:1287 start_codon:yes stop_codon:yes gene_type:complete